MRVQRRAFLRYCRNLVRGLQIQLPDASVKKVGSVERRMIDAQRFLLSPR